MPVKKVESRIKNQESREKPEVITRSVTEKKITAKAVGLSVPVYSLDGVVSGTMSLPKEVFGAKVNNILLTQVMRVYMSNQKTLLGSTKTRGEVVGSTAKIYNQKGTGRARHGAIRAPLFVGGGIVFGPKPRKVVLDLPKKMKKVALISALSSKLVDKNIFGVTGLEKATGKTKELTEFLYKVLSIKYKGEDKKSKKAPSVLIITGEKVDNVVRAVKNIQGVKALSFNLINAYEVLKHDILLVTKQAVEALVKPKVKETK